ncbi:hypothetical protein TgHK011_006071 [Trichoderma gracile]|nr:hypothetical protein TgHK011_006071 [Trichoderma gracile]
MSCHVTSCACVLRGDSEEKRQEKRRDGETRYRTYEYRAYRPQVTSTRGQLISQPLITNAGEGTRAPYLTIMVRAGSSALTRRSSSQATP